MKREKPRYIEHAALHCPSCNFAGTVRTYATRNDGFGRVRYGKCSHCGQRVVVSIVGNFKNCTND